MNDPLQARKCGSCKHIRDRKSTDQCGSKQLRFSVYWCDKLGVPTEALLLRCGGDDYEPVFPGTKP